MSFVGERGGGDVELEYFFIGFLGLGLRFGALALGAGGGHGIRRGFGDQSIANWARVYDVSSCGFCREEGEEGV